jgi:hypothetical protein
MLGCAADLHVGAGTVIRPAERITALAVEVVAAAAVVIVAAAPSTAFVLLSWPHLSFTNSLSSLIRGHAVRRSKAGARLRVPRTGRTKRPAACLI